MQLKYLSLILLFSAAVFSACHTSDKMGQTKEEKKEVQQGHLIKDQFIVQLHPDVKPEDLVNANTQYGLVLKKAINARMHLWVFTYNLNSLEPEKMLDHIRNSSFVKMAEFDKRVENRN